MKCKECGTYEDEFDDRMGELICIGCGFVKDVHIFEETSPADVLINKAGRYLSENDDGVLEHDLFFQHFLKYKH